MPEPTDTQWYCLLARGQIGPLTPGEMAALIRSGEVGSATLVWREGLADWLPAERTELRARFSRRVAAAVPPPPAAAASARGAGSGYESGPTASGSWSSAAAATGRPALLGPCFGEAWRLFKQYPGAFILGNLVFLLINSVAFGLLLGNWQAGVAIMLHKARAGETVVWGDIFQGFDRFGPVFGAGLIFSLAVAAGAFFCVVPAFFVGGYLLYLVPLVAIRGVSVGEAITLSGQMVRGYLWNHAFFFFMICLLGFAGVLLCYVGLIITLPLYYLALAAAFEHNFGQPARDPEV
ncbi:MAG: DUF4339 domain-containing protein [Deltaproteobacteria bacterium]|nr:DUF4339 domain-containing protein [Deltaproteobacteria bacterium]